MKKILITGGPVHGYIDAVKLVTNKFKGGLIAEMATNMAKKYTNNVHITYLTTKDSRVPEDLKNIDILFHDGFDDYMEKVKSLSQEMDSVILGAAVANLIPAETIKGKFPSHNYKPGDVIPINFKIAPRVVDEVKKVNPNVHLFAFKLLAGVPHEELVRAAYEIVLESKATAVFANQVQDLTTKYAITKERGEHKMHKDEIIDFIWDCIHDQYYKTEIIDHDHITLPLDEDMNKFNLLKEIWKKRFTYTPEGYVFGTIAVKRANSMITTGRGKKELNSQGYVINIDHENLIVPSYKNKVTLNAPLLDNIFKNNPEAYYIIHLHEFNKDIPTYDYAPPGTVRDSIRNIKGSFNISGHGCFLVFDNNNNLL